MALPKVDPIDIHYLDQWFANIVNQFNFNINQIESAVPALNNVLSNADTAPIPYLRDSFNNLVKGINLGFNNFDERLRKLEQGGK